MVDAESNQSWTPALVAMLGERRIQEILLMKPQRLSLAQWLSLKKRFRKKVPLTHRHLSEAYARHQRLIDLCMAFTQAEKRWLLTVLVPDDLEAEKIVNESWDNRRGFTISDIFRNRFESASIETLRRFIEGKCELPDGMVLAETKIRNHHESLDLMMKTLLSTKQSARSHVNHIKLMNSKMRKARVAKLDGGRSEITSSIHQLLGKRATTLFHDGTSTYGEPSGKGKGWKDIADALSIKPMTKDDIILDLGSGSAATLWQLCQYHNCKGIGIEYGEARLRSAARCTVALLRKHGNNPNFNSQVVNTHGNIMNLTTLPPCTVLYIYDEAFPDDLMDKIFELVESAPPRLRYIITFKANKFSEYRAKLQDCTGFHAVSLGNRVTKAFSAEGSSFDLYERRVEANDIVPSATHCERFEDYWKNSIEGKKEYYDKLHDSMDGILNKKRSMRTARR
jgi:hypothetical protein